LAGGGDEAARWWVVPWWGGRRGASRGGWVDGAALVTGGTGLRMRSGGRRLEEKPDLMQLIKLQ